jgi:hypothetical protein
MRDATSLEERSLRHVRFREIGNPDGMEQKPYESQPEIVAEDHRVRRRSNRPFPFNSAGARTTWQKKQL